MLAYVEDKTPGSHDSTWKFGNFSFSSDFIGWNVGCSIGQWGCEVVTEELFALVDFQSFQSQPQRVCLHANFWLWIRKGKERPHFIAFQDVFMYIYIYMKYIYIELLLFISLKVSSNVLWMVKWWVPRQSAIIGPNSVAISHNLTPNHRKIPINSGKSGLVKSYPPTLRKVMQDAIQREDLAAGPGVELEKMGNCWIFVGGEVWYSIFVWSQMVSQGWNDSKSIIWIRKAAFCFGGKLAVHTGDIYIYMALKEVNRKYKHAFWCWWLVFLIAKI